MLAWYDWGGLVSLGVVCLAVFWNPAQQMTRFRTVVVWLGAAGCAVSIVIRLLSDGSLPLPYG